MGGWAGSHVQLQAPKQKVPKLSPVHRAASLVVQVREGRVGLLPRLLPLCFFGLLDQLSSLGLSAGGWVGGWVSRWAGWVGRRDESNAPARSNSKRRPNLTCTLSGHPWWAQVHEAHLASLIAHGNVPHVSLVGSAVRVQCV